MQLYRILTNAPYRESLQVPDGSRKIFDADEKYAATGRLYDELKALIDDVAKALAPYHIVTQAKTAALERSIHLG